MNMHSTIAPAAPFEIGAGVTFRSDRRYAEFRAWAEDMGGEFVDIPAGTFKESGTGVASVMLTIRKGEA